MRHQRAAALTAALAVAAPMVAGAFEPLAVSVFASQGFEARSGGDGDDAPLRSSTDLGVTLSRSSDLTTWRVSPGVRFSATSNGVKAGSFAPRLDSSFTTLAGPYRFSGGLQILPQFVDETQFRDRSRSDGEALQLSISGNLQASMQATPVDSFSLGLNARSRTFLSDTETLSDSRSIGVNGGWTRSLSPLTSGSLTPSLTYFESDGGDGSRGQTAALRFGLNHSLDPVTSVSANLGPSLTFRSDRDASFGVVGGLGFSRQGRDTSLSLSLSQEVDQDSDGVLENQTRLSFSLSQRITGQSSIGLTAGAGLQIPLDSGGEDRRTYSLSPSYNHSITPEWSVSLGYRLAIVDEDDGLDTTNIVFFRISRGLTLTQ